MELSEKETKVIEMMAVGMKKAEIAQNLAISKRTVESYHEKIRAKLAAKSLYEALYLYGCHVTRKEIGDRLINQ